ncbi:MAG: ABC transporter permease [Rhizobiaceae bacterium]|nr:ABC transporter permease [Rhizobiaceae bacterium]
MATESPSITLKSRTRENFLVVALMLAFFLAWEASVVWFDVPEYVIPTPSRILQKLVSDITSGTILPHLQVTLIEVLLGFVLAAIGGLALGTASGLFPLFDRLTYPFILAFQAVPKVAIAPLLIIWFGYGIQSKVVTAAVIAFFPLFVNVSAGLKEADPRRLMLMRSLRASPLQTYIKVRLPGLMPYLFSGLEVALVLSIIGAIVGEFIGASVGLGSIIVQRQASIDVAGVFSVIIILSLMAVILTWLLRLVQARYRF